MKQTSAVVPSEPERTHIEQARLLRTMMILRVIIVTALLGSALFVQLFYGRTSDALYFIIGLTYLLTVFYAVLAIPFKASRAYAFVQLLIDVALVSLLVLATGAMDSYFITLYYLLVAAGAVALGRVHSFALAIVAAGELATVLLVANTGIVDLSILYLYQIPSLPTILYTIGLHTFAMLLLAALSGYLAGMLQKTAARLRQRTADLSQLRMLHENIVRSISAGIITTDFEGNITFANPAAEPLLQVTRSDMLGLEIRSLLHYNPSAPGPIIIDDSWSREMLLLRGSEMIDVLVSRTLLIGQDNYLEGKLYVIQDLRELKALQEQLRIRDRLAAAGKMSAAIAHEIRNPLGAISGSAQMISKAEGLSEDLHYYLDIIVRESDRVSSTLNNFLAFARQPVFSPIKIDIVPVVRETVSLFAHSPDVRPDHKIDFIVDGIEKLDAVVDPNMLRQLVYNLIINGVRAMPNGGRLKVELSRDGENAILFIADSGIGIKPENLQNIFHPFTSFSKEGVGLGMAIVYRITQEHGGSVIVKSLEGRGTSVTVRLPLERGSSSEFSAKAIAAEPM
jgi:two-component system sensor histidine kinase PilS (NtrC family)